MSARELFEILGYHLVKSNDKSKITYVKRRFENETTRVYEITFDLEKKSYYKSINGFGPCHVFVEEHRAINQQFREMNAFIKNDFIQSRKGENHGKGFKK